ncbi:MAG: hypothetical protein KDB23_34170, partial [Planctomycetales bacterium]|nr:hypothetical protein [Planctomycetales bacterium]
HTLASPGVAYVTYLHVPLPEKPAALQELLRENQSAQISVALPPGQYQLALHDTKTGDRLAAIKIEQNRQGDYPLEIPRFSNDIVVTFTVLQFAASVSSSP